LKVPVVIVGAGACGLTAALAARDAGAEVLVLERDRIPAGSTSLSSGFIPAAGTRYQRAAGIDDSPELFAADVQRKNHGEADPRIVETLCRGIGPTLEWLDDRHGVRFDVLQGFTYPGHSRLRMHAVAEKTGAGLMAALLRACADVDILTSACVSDLSDRNVVFQRPDGKVEQLEYGALVLACSGFGGNKELVRRHLPEIAEALYFGHVGNQGDALRWGTALGAQAKDMSAYQGHGSVATPHGILVTWALMTEGGIQVNSNGERFANEHAGYSEACAMRRDFSLHGLSNTLEAVSRYADGKEQDPFGRDFTTKPKLVPPCYAIKVTGALFHTQGGLVVDEQARVVPLPNVFAGGGAARGVSGAHVWGYLSGNGLLSAVGLGRIAGESAATTGKP
jgi:fumarate reductase flavoprotein subunit